VDETIWWQGLHGSEEKPEKKQKEIKQLTNPNPKVITLDKKTLRKLSKLNPSYLYLLKILIEKVKADPENILWKNLRETCKDRDILAFTYTRGRNENGWIKAKHEHLFNMLKRSRIIKKEEDCWKLTIKREDLLIAVPVWDNEKIMSIMNQLLVCYIKTVQENMPRIKWVKETGASRLESFIKEMGVENGKIDAIINHLEYLGGENIAVAKWWLKNHKQLDRDKLLEITILQYLKRVRINESEKDWKRKTFFKEVIKFLKSREIYSSNAVIKNAMARMAERGVDEASWWIMVHNRKLAKSYRESYILNYIQNIRKMDEKEWRKKITPGVIARELKVITGGIMKETVKTYLIALAKEGNKDALWWVEVYEVEIET
jgi:hypothetical protein